MYVSPSEIEEPTRPWGHRSSTQARGLKRMEVSYKVGINQFHWFQAIRYVSRSTHRSIHGGNSSHSFGFRNHDPVADVLESARAWARFLMGTVLAPVFNVGLIGVEKREFGILTLLPRSRAGHSAEFTPIVVIPIEEIHCAATDRC